MEFNKVSYFLIYVFVFLDHYKLIQLLVFVLVYMCVHDHPLYIHTHVYTYTLTQRLI